MLSSLVLMHRSKRVTHLPMRNIPVGSTVHNVELRPGKGAQLARSAGAYAQIVARDRCVRNYYVYVLAKCVKFLAEGRATHR